MLKAITFLTVGLVAGVLLMALLQPMPTPAAGDTFELDVPAPVAASSGGFAELDGRLAAIEQRLDTLVTAVEALQTVPTAAVQAGQVAPPAAFAPATLATLPPRPNGVPAGAVAIAAAAPVGGSLPFMLSSVNSFENDVQRLVEGGFTRDRAEALRRRADELALEQMQARYEAERDGRPPPSDPLAGFGPEQALRAEVGDAEYEQYLKALGRPTEVSVFSVLADSPAEKAGMKSGDKIISYGGTRVFDMREINPLTLQGTPGESVVVEIEREGRRMQVMVPRGPLGISGGAISSMGNATRIQVLRP